MRGGRSGRCQAGQPGSQETFGRPARRWEGSVLGVRIDIAQAGGDRAGGRDDFATDAVKFGEDALRWPGYADSGDRDCTVVEHRRRTTGEGLLEFATIVGETAPLDADETSFEGVFVDNGFWGEALQLEAVDEGMPLVRA